MTNILRYSWLIYGSIIFLLLAFIHLDIVSEREDTVLKSLVLKMDDVGGKLIDAYCSIARAPFALLHDFLIPRSFVYSFDPPVKPTPTPIVRQEIVYEEIDTELMNNLRNRAGEIKTEIDVLQDRQWKVSENARKGEELLDSLVDREEKMSDLPKVAAMFRNEKGELTSQSSKDIKQQVNDFCDQHVMERFIPVKKDKDNLCAFSVPGPYFAKKVVFDAIQRRVTLKFLTKGKVLFTQTFRNRDTIVFEKPVFFTSLIIETDDQTCPSFTIYEAPRFAL